MIAFLRGKFFDKSPAKLIVDVNGVGYEVQISLNTFGKIEKLEEGTLITYLHITENTQTLFGFAETSEKTLFLQLLSVSGIGPSSARMMLSGLSPDEIVKAIVQDNVKQLEGIKGIGKKTAQRLIVELKDKLAKVYDTKKLEVLSHLPNDSAVNYNDAIEALVALGIGRPVAEKAIEKINKLEPEIIDLQDIIKKALQIL